MEVGVRIRLDVDKMDERRTQDATVRDDAMGHA